ncbi:hypothetical protein [Mycoplana dimorpha]|uniref:hypothetical protein n=1 Tax=Mycoplana dimorpha TaxID=28320 RepID=UPI001AEC8E2A|nr:hypothetical protein [Mycoplana dimorpha]
MFIKTTEPAEATGEIPARYDAEEKVMGLVMQATQSLRQADVLSVIYALWRRRRLSVARSRVRQLDLLTPSRARRKPGAPAEPKQDCTDV